MRCVLVVAALLALGALLLTRAEPLAPQVTLETRVDVVGRATPLRLTARDRGTGLASVELRLVPESGTPAAVATESHPNHGLGLCSLHGHLSEIAVSPGAEVGRGDVLGRTGETGLAAGDHLHFGVMIRGVHVDPLEWWDAHWIHDHVEARLAAFPRAGGLPGDAS